MTEKEKKNPLTYKQRSKGQKVPQKWPQVPPQKALNGWFCGTLEANSRSTVHFHGPGVPFLESLGRMASGNKPTPWSTPCSRAPKTMGKNGPKRLWCAQHRRGGGLKPQKIKFVQNWQRVGLWCKRTFPPPILGVPEAVVQVPSPNSL